MSTPFDFITGAEDIIKRFIPDPTAQANFQLELMKQQIAVPLAEEKSGDKWTSRARPSFMYIFYFLLVMLIVIFPVIGVFSPSSMAQFYLNVNAGFKAIPHDLWTTFTCGYLGYSAMRTHEKQPFFGGK